VLPILAACLEESNSDADFNADILSETEVHLLSLKEELSRYFLDIVSNLFALVKSVITFDVVKSTRNCTRRIYQNDSDTYVKPELSSFLETQFWVCRLLDYLALANIVLTILLLFPTTYECEVGFSSLLQIKTKDRNIPDVEDDL
jgi:hypothetical protein